MPWLYIQNQFPHLCIYNDYKLSLSFRTFYCLRPRTKSVSGVYVKGTGNGSVISSRGKLLGKQNRSPSTWQVFSLVSPHLGPSPPLFPLFLCCWPCSSWSPTFWHSPGCCCCYCCCCCSRLLYKLWGVLASCLLPRLVVLYGWKEHNLIYMFILRELPQFVAFVGVSVLCLSEPHVAATR